MKPGRNDPCPCVSERKYKKYSYGNEQSMTVKNSSDLQNSEKNHEGNSLDLQEAMIKIISDMRGYTLDKKAHIKEYKEIRRLHDEVGSSMIQHYDGKFEQEVDMAADTDGLPLPEQRGVFHSGSEFDLRYLSQHNRTKPADPCVINFTKINNDCIVTRHNV